jgi:energy-converting hydrogenase Eha subunit A
MKVKVELLDQMVELVLNLIGLSGLLLIGYGFLSERLNDTWAPVESIADWLAVIVTLVAVVITAISIWLPPVSRPPDDRSKYVTAPIVLLMVALAAGYMALSSRVLPHHTTLGFSILGLAGTLFRTVSYGRHTIGGAKG